MRRPVMSVHTETRETISSLIGGLMEAGDSELAPAGHVGDHSQ
jgi:hypothetical protein